MAQVVSLTPVRPSPQPPAPPPSNRLGSFVGNSVTTAADLKLTQGMPPVPYLHAISAHPPDCPSRSQPLTVHPAHKRPFPTHQHHTHTPPNHPNSLSLTAATARWPRVCPTPGGHRSELTAPPTLTHPPAAPPLHFIPSRCIAPLHWHSPLPICRCAGGRPARPPHPA